jgi:cytoskeleton protein RodZ
VLFKWAKYAGIVVAVIVLLLIVKAAVSAFSSSSASRAAASAPATTPATAAPTYQQPAAREATLTLVATNPVHVKVQRKNADESYGETVFDGALGRGETRTIPRPGALYVTATACENLLIEINGKRYPMGMTGYATGQLPAP